MISKALLFAMLLAGTALAQTHSPSSSPSSTSSRTHTQSVTPSVTHTVTRSASRSHTASTSVTPSHSQATSLTPSTSATASSSASPSPSFKPALQCNDCILGSSGPCQQNNGVCHQFISGETCPPGTDDCRTLPGMSVPATHTCSSCVGGSLGPCQAADGVCSAFQDPRVYMCSPATFDCSSSMTLPALTCTDCVLGSTGPCQQPNGVCSAYTNPAAHQCSPGSWDCEYTGTDDQCRGCANGSSGTCQAIDGVCHEYADFISRTCPTGTTACMNSVGVETGGAGNVVNGMTMCTGCVLGSSGPCYAPHNGACSAFINPAAGQCSPGTVRCGSFNEPSPSNTPSSTHTATPSNTPTYTHTETSTSTASITTTPTPSLTPTPSPACQGCLPGTAGNCRSTFGVCSGYLDDINKICPPSTIDCTLPAGAVCSACIGGSTGTCIDANSVCHSYIGGTVCPANTVSCLTGHPSFNEDGSAASAASGAAAGSGSEDDGGVSNTLLFAAVGAGVGVGMLVVAPLAVVYIRRAGRRTTARETTYQAPRRRRKTSVSVPTSMGVDKQRDGKSNAPAVASAMAAGTVSGSSIVDPSGMPYVSVDNSFARTRVGHALRSQSPASAGAAKRQAAGSPDLEV